MIRCLCGLLCLLWASLTPAYSIESPEEQLANPLQEAQAEAIGHTLRCLVCQNESIEESHAPLARDLRKIVRQHIVRGQSKEEIMQWMTKRYGDFIRLEPVFDEETALLWLMPFLALGGAILLARHVWSNPSPPPTPLTAEEKMRLHKLLSKE